MRPPLWHPPIERSTAEQAIIKRIRWAKLFVFLRQQRHTLLAAAFQQALMTLSTDQPPGHPPVPPAQLALATLRQAYTQVSDDEGIEATTMERRWPWVLDCLACETPPFSQGTLVVFRQRLSAQQMERRLLERTVEVAAPSGACGARQWRAALESSPLWGAGRVEDTDHLWGHALRQAVGVLARQQGRGLPAVANEVGAPMSSGSSLKAARDMAWDEPPARQQALTIVLDALHAVDHWLAPQPAAVAVPPEVAASLAGAHQVRAPDITLTPTGAPSLRQGVAEARRLSVEDGERRHGRKSRSLLVDGDKRQVLRALDASLSVAVGITPANAPEAPVTAAIETDWAAQQCPRWAWPIDRAYWASERVHPRADTLALCCKAWPVRQGPYVATSAFHRDWAPHAWRGPGGAVMPFAPGEVVPFPAATGGAWALRERCTTSASGRSVSMHPDEALVQELRERQQTPQGRAQWRERVAVEHALAPVGHWQGRRARYRGVRKNVCDLRRCAVVHNLHVLMRLPQTERQAA